MQYVIGKWADRHSEIKKPMDDETMTKEWDKFAKSIGGTILASKANYFDRDNHFKITTDKTEVELTWGNQPQRGRGPYVTLESKLRFKISANNQVTLTVRPKDFLSGLFSTKKRKFGVKELDNSFIFSSNSDGLIYELTDTFKDFNNKNKYKNFVIETETISDVPILTIFIPELITTQDKLAYYYDFGLKISKALSADI